MQSPAGSGHHQGCRSCQCCQELRGGGAGVRGQVVFRAVVCKAVWPYGVTPFSQSQFLICTLWRIVGPALQGVLCRASESCTQNTRPGAWPTRREGSVSASGHISEMCALGSIARMRTVLHSLGRSPHLICSATL